MNLQSAKNNRFFCVTLNLDDVARMKKWPPLDGSCQGPLHPAAGLPLPSEWVRFYPGFLVGINPGPLIPNVPSANGYFSSLPQLLQEQGKTKLYFPSSQLGIEWQKP